MTAWWPPRSLRVRLTASFVLLGAVLVAAATLGVSELVARTVWLPLDAALEEEATDLALVLHEELREAKTHPSGDGDAADILAHALPFFEPGAYGRRERTSTTG